MKLSLARLLLPSRLSTLAVPTLVLVMMSSLTSACSDDETPDKGDDDDATSSSGGTDPLGTGGNESSSGGDAGDTGGTGGSESTGGFGGEMGVSVPRPQLTDSAALLHTPLVYLSTFGSVVNPVKDDWDPTAGLPAIETFTADFSVAASGGTHTTVQAAIDAAVLGGGTDRVYISVEPGTYRELVCLNSATPPITIYGTGAEASETEVVFDNYAGLAKGENDVAQPCNPNLGSATIGTSGSTTFYVKANGFQAKNLTFNNDTDETGLSGSLQAVALTTQGDQIVLDDVRILGNQDTFYPKGLNPAMVVRVYVKNSYIAGDTDFIFGDARVVIEDSELHVVGDRKPNGVLMAPSTHSRNEYGFLVYNSTVSADENVTFVALGRAWDQSQGTLDNYKQSVLTGDYPNGAAVVRDTQLNAPVAAAPWANAATTDRPFSSVDTEDLPANRLYEFNNTGTGAAQ